MKLNPTNTTFICPRNDAESATIIEILRKSGFEVRISKQQTWFCPLDNEPDETFENLKEIVVIVEMPGLESEARLAEKHEVIIVDHHGYPSLGLNRENSRSSIEQVAELIGYELSDFEKGVSINDQEYIYGLIKNDYSEEVIKKIRALDLKMQGYTEEQFQINMEDQQKPVFHGPDIYHYETRIPKYSYLIDLHVIKQKGRFSNVVITGKSDEKKKKLIFFSGSMDKIKKLKELGGYSKQSNEQYGLWGGYEDGEEKVNLDEALNIILHK
jgi:hypothetical protein